MSRKNTGPKLRSGSGVRWTGPELRIADRYAQAIVKGRYPHAVAAVPDCQAALDRLRRRIRDAARPDRVPPPWRAKQGIHIQLLKRARLFGRPRLLVPWHRSELTLLDRYARLVARGRFATAREAGRACAEALRELHDARPREFEGVPYRTAMSLQHRLWPRVARLRFRWFNSHWAAVEAREVDRHARLLLKRRYPNVMEAARECCRSLARLHARQERRGPKCRRNLTVRTVPGVYDRLRTRASELDRFQLPCRHWTAEERKVALRWVRKYDRHRQGKLRMNLATTADMMQAELERRGYYRGLGACVSEIVGQRRRLLLGA